MCVSDEGRVLHFVHGHARQSVCGESRTRVYGCGVHRASVCLFGVTSSSMRRDSKDVAASHLHSCALLRQQRRCGVTLADCCCGSRDVAASHSVTTVAAQLQR